MRIDLKAIRSKAAALVTLPNILGATTVLLLVIINWDVLVLRYHAFLEWAPWLPTAVTSAFAYVLAIGLGLLLGRANAFLLDLVYFRPLKRLNSLEREVHGQYSRLHSEAHGSISKLIGRSFCQGVLLSILAKDLTGPQRQELREFADFIKGTRDCASKDGALEMLKEFTAHGRVDSRTRFKDSE